MNKSARLQALKPRIRAYASEYKPYWFSFVEGYTATFGTCFGFSEQEAMRSMEIYLDDCHADKGVLEASIE